MNKKNSPRFCGAFFVGILLWACSVAGQNRLVTGVVMEDSTQKPINLATVVNLRTQQITKTNRQGTFLITARTGDALKITCATCPEVRVAVDSSGEDILVRISNVIPIDGVLLDEVVVRGKTEAQIRKEIKEFLEEPVMRKNLSGDQLLDLAGTSSVELLYQLFSKRAKSLRKLAVEQQKYRKEKLAEYRYNKSYLAEITKLSGEDLDFFTRYAAVPPDFAICATEYELLRHVLACYHRFKLKNPFVSAEY